METGGLIFCIRDKYNEDGKLLYSKDKFYIIYYMSPYRVYVIGDDGMLRDFIVDKYHILFGVKSSRSSIHGIAITNTAGIFGEYFQDTTELEFSELIRQTS